MKRSILILTTMIAVAGTLACSSVKVKSDWDKTVDFSRYSTWSLSKGSVPPTSVAKAVVNEAVGEVMAAKGYTKVEGTADCYIAIHAEADEWFDGGLLKIEALEGKTRNTVWRGKAEGAVNVQSTAKRQKLAQRVTKKMFKKFPDKRIE